MSPRHIPDVLSADEPFIADALPARRRSLPRGYRPTRLLDLPDLLLGGLGWCWRWLVLSLLCMNYWSSIFVVGWLYRWMQGVVLRGWWERSRLSDEMSFADFCDRLGPDAPTTRPRLLVQERVSAALARPAPDGGKPTGLRTFLRYLRVPWNSAWLNLRVGFLALFCTYALTGFGCLLMAFSWWGGWNNSFHKGYEEAFVGPFLGVSGILLFVAAMIYVPMAQVHQAVTGEAQAFFHFRTVWRLIQARPVTYVALAALTALASLPLEVLRTIPEFFGQMGAYPDDATNAEVLQFYQTYRFCCALVLMTSLLVLRLFAAFNYRSAVLVALRRGWLDRSDLHPRVEGWLDRLGLLEPEPGAPEVSEWGPGSLAWWGFGVANLLLFAALLLALLLAGAGGLLVVAVPWAVCWLLVGAVYVGLVRGVRAYLRFTAWQVAFGLLFWIWFLFVAKVYVAEFMNHHPVTGFMNHPVVQLPCLDSVPGHLYDPDEPLD
jgi:hypothetical protein